jgi:hypothetical protein
MDNFHHDDQVDRGFCDFRKDISRPTSLLDLYYVVLRVKAGNSVWYHHTAMAIDGDLPCHIEALKSVVRVTLDWSKVVLTCVFIRNFITQDSFVMDRAVQLGIAKELNTRISNGAIFCDKVERFLVFGFAGKDRIALVEVAAREALDASTEAIKMYVEQMKEELMPIDIIAVSPVIPGIIKLFEKSAPQLLALINTQCKAR